MNEKGLKSKIKFPHAFVLLFSLILFVGLLTYVIPAGSFARDDIGSVIPGTFEYLDKQTPVSIFNIIKSIPQAYVSASALLVMILLIGAAIRVFDSTGAINRAIISLSKKLGNIGDKVVLIGISLFFMILGGFPGMLEAAIPFAPLCIGIALLLGYDALVGIFISLVPIALGWTAGPTNPWTTGIGQNIAGIQMFSGLGYRLVIWLVFFIIQIIFLMYYTNKIKNNPSKSAVYGMDTSHLKIEQPDTSFTLRDAVILLVFAATIFTVVYGALNLEFGLFEMSTVYIIGAIVGGFAAKYSPGKIADKMLEGAKIILIGAAAAGLARAINIVMSDGNIADTIVYNISELLKDSSPYVNATLMMVIQSLINFLIPSGSGQAYATLPIMIPIADIIGVSKQTAILAYQFGDGLSNILYPTVGTLIAFLMYAKISFSKWLKFILPFALIAYGIALIFMIIAVAIGFS